MADLPTRRNGCTIVVNDGALTLTATSGTTVLAALAGHGVFLPSACGGRGLCGRCRVKVLEGGGPVQPAEERKLSQAERADSVRLACQCKVTPRLRIAIPDELLSIREFACRVERIVDLTPDMKQFRLALVTPASISFVPGQYLQLLTPVYEKSSEEIWRAYSISSDPRDSTAIELVIRLVPGGICTTYCFTHLTQGDRVRLQGPHGNFHLSNSQAPMVMIAGGSGIAPIKCLLHHMANTGCTREAVFFFGANHEHDLCCLDQMAAFAKVLPQFTFVPVVAMPKPDWTGARGLVTEAVDTHFQSLAGHEAYLCGSPGMINAAIAVLNKHGMPDTQVFYDKFA